MSEGQGDEAVEAQMGARLRHARKTCGYSQRDLARALGVSFQQVQKYESGANRLSGAVILRACRFLGIRPGDLFPPEEGGGAAVDWTLFTDDEAVELVRAFGRIGAADVRRAILQLTRVSAQASPQT